MNFNKNIIAGLIFTGAVAAGLQNVSAEPYVTTTYNKEQAAAVEQYRKDHTISDLIGDKPLEKIPFAIGKEQKEAVVTCDLLNLRDGSGTDQKSLTLLKNGEKVTVLGTGKSKNWAYVSSIYGKGFVHTKYIKETGKTKAADEQAGESILTDLDEDACKELKKLGVTITGMDDDMSLLEKELTGKNLEQICFRKVQSEKRYVNTTSHMRLRIRSGCSTVYPEIGLMNYGDEVMLLGYAVNEKWAYVSYDGKEGFAFAEYLSKEKPQAATAASRSTEENESKNVEQPAEDEASESAEHETGSVETVSSSRNGEYLGTFKLTFYCNCSQCCGSWSGGPTASGAYPSAGRTIAVDPSVIPLGSRVVINGHKYVAEDIGSSIVGNRIDVYMDSHQAALDRGVEYAEVYLAE